MVAIDSGPRSIIELITREKNSIVPPNEIEIAVHNWHQVEDAANNSGRSIPILSKISAKETALIVVDMQRAFLEPGAALEVPSGNAIINNINKLSSSFRSLGGTVVFLRYLVDEKAGLLPLFEGRSYLPGGRVAPIHALKKEHQQFELHPDIDVRESDLLIDKRRYSGVIGSDMVEKLRQRNIVNAIVAGVTTDVCAGNTAESLMQMDFHVVMVWDGTAALSRLAHEMFLARFFLLYGDVMPAEEILERLQE